MPRVSLSGVVFEHGGAGPFATPIDLDLGPGWTGVVGPNGAGKTTLLRLITGELAPAAGHVRVDAPAGVRRLAQTVEWTTPLAAQLERLAGDWSARAGRLRGQLALPPLGHNELAELWPRCSPGERKRWQLAAALAEPVSVLLCDEPSNHLDDRARVRLLAGLREHEGVGVLVSHDRALLDALTRATVFVERDGRIELRPGSYGEAAREREAERDHLREQYANARAAERRLAAQVQAARERQEQTSRSRRASSRKRDPHDHDASSMARKYRADRAAASADAVLRRTLSAHAQQRERAAVQRVPADANGALFVDWVAPRKSVLVELCPSTLPHVAPHPGTRLPRGRAVQVRRDDRVHVTGANGAGKTSLLTALAARARLGLGAEKVLWLPQALDAGSRRDLLVQLAGLDRASRGRVLQIVAAAGGDPDALLQTPDPSPGEARKLALALGLARQAWLLILDEPCNHLDLPAREAVEAMLARYPGALLLTSHDPRFAGALTTESWRLP